MDHNDALATEETTVTDTAIDNNLEENQATTTKTYSQTEVDNMMARMRGSLQKKLLKPYEDLGDPDKRHKSEQKNKLSREASSRKHFRKRWLLKTLRSQSEIRLFVSTKSTHHCSMLPHNMAVLIQSKYEHYSTVV